MPAPLSNDLRNRILKAIKEEGLSCRAAAIKYGVSISTSIRLRQHEKTYGTHEPLRVGGFRPHKLEPYHHVIIKLIETTPDATLAELQKILSTTHISVNSSTIYRYLEHIKFSLKKRHYLPRNKTEKTLDTVANNGKNIKGK